MDLTKLTPAPWWVQNENADEVFPVDGSALPVNVLIGEQEDRVCQCNIGECDPVTNAEFIALARNDLDVKQRRGWHTQKCNDAEQWMVPQLIEHLCGKDKLEGRGLIEAMYQDGHDVGLLAKADRWYRENVENVPPA